jgi:hypothetical protein
MPRRTTRIHTIRGGQEREVWTLRSKGNVEVFKHTVRVAKGQPGGGQFHGATNLRGTVLSAD